MTGALLLFGSGLVVFGAAVAIDTLVAWVIRRWRARHWERLK